MREVSFRLFLVFAGQLNEKSVSPQSDRRLNSHEKKKLLHENHMNETIYTLVRERCDVFTFTFIQNVSENCSRFRLSACTYLHLTCTCALLTHEFSSSISLQSERSRVSVCTSEYRALDIKTTNNARTYVFIRFSLFFFISAPESDGRTIEQTKYWCIAQMCARVCMCACVFVQQM